MKWKTALLVAVGVLIAAPAAQAQFGIGTIWEGGSLQPVVALPIMFGENMVLQPGVRFWAIEDGDTRINLLLSAEMHLNPGGTTGLIGGRGQIDILSPDIGDSRTDISFGGFIGGSAELAENVSIVGQVGGDLFIQGDDAPMIITTSATVTLRWWVFGN